MLSTTITSDPGILCFHHCAVKVFCFTLPSFCPNCHTGLETGAITSSLESDADNGDANATVSATTTVITTPAPSVASRGLLPFRLPYPFVRASQYPCAIVLRPTTGDFLNDYNNATDLHIAVTTSGGCIVEFDRNGLQRRRPDNMAEWWQCLLVGDVPEPWFDLWDSVLLQACMEPSRWTVEHYNEESYNCYTFVLTFLQSLGYGKLSEAARSKTAFCEKYIVPRTTTAGKYISLYRKLRDAGIYVHPQHQQQQHHGRGYHQESPSSTVTSSEATITSTTSTASTTLATSSSSSVLSSLSSSSSSSPLLATEFAGSVTANNSISTRAASSLCTIEE